MNELHWNVFKEDVNQKSIVIYDIFKHSFFKDDVLKAFKECKNNFEAFSEKVERDLMYWYWSKCEWEIVLTSWPEKDDFNKEKVDVYFQVMLNWNVFIDYVWRTLNGLM